MLNLRESLQGLAGLHKKYGRNAEAIRCIQEAAQVFEEGGEPERLVGCHITVGEIHKGLGEEEEAMEKEPLMKIQRAFSKKGQGKMVKIKLCAYFPPATIGAINLWFSNNGAKLMSGTPAATANERDIVKLLK